MADKKEEKSISQYCAESLLPNIVKLRKNAGNILKRSDIEDIHDLRVSSRRIRTILDVFSDYLPDKKKKAWVKDIRDITKSFGAVRDLDVQIELIDQVYASTEDRRIRSGLRRVRLRLKQKRSQKQEKTKKSTQIILSSPSIDEMNEWVGSILDDKDGDAWNSSELFRLGYKQIQTRLDEFLLYEIFIFDPDRVEELHQMRISAKQLRYALEVFSRLYEKKTDFALDIARQSQEYLGTIHDCDVWIDFLPDFMQKEVERIKEFYGYRSPYNRIKPGIEYLISNRKKERRRSYRSFLKDWKVWKEKETWLNLRKVIFMASLEDHGQPPQKKPEQPQEKTPPPPAEHQTSKK
jgi:CHAD domain-containing protein